MSTAYIYSKVSKFQERFLHDIILRHFKLILLTLYRVTKNEILIMYLPLFLYFSGDCLLLPLLLLGKIV